MEFVEGLHSILSNYHTNIEEKSLYNETEIRTEFIDPFLELLGWDVRNVKGLSPRIKEVRAENYYVDTGKPDYSLTLSGIVKFFIEVKRPSVKINKNNVLGKECVFQAKKYGWSAKHPIVILTNFEYLIIYDCTYVPNKDDAINVGLIESFHYTDFENKFEEIRNYISRDVVYSGEWDNAIESKRVIDTGRKIDQYFLDQINHWRLSLANTLYENNRTITFEKLNDVTQEFLTQMIFLRYCEEKNLHKFHTLLEISKDKKELKEKLRILLSEADKKYDANLFDSDDCIYDLDDQLVIEIIESLYHPKSPYDFSVIDSNLLGEVYELYLSEKIQIINNELKLMKKKENIHRDVLSTPYEVVRYMVNDALNKICENKTIDELLELRIIDISCGSGIYLVDVLDYLFNKALLKIEQNGGHGLIEIGNDLKKINLELKQKILSECIYGIDLDPNAVQVTKYNLAIKLLETELFSTLEGKNAIIPPLNQNIIAGNSLIKVDHIRKYDLSSDDIKEIFPNNWNLKNGINKFNLIIGNPPYTSKIDMHKILNEKEIHIYDKEYTTSYRQYDKYFIFIEKAISILKDNGMLTYIVPNKFSRIVSGKKIRKYISQKYLYKYVDFGSLQLFKDRTIYSTIIQIYNTDQDILYYKIVDNLYKWWSNPDDYEDIIYDKLSSSNIITENPWIFVHTKKESDLINQLYKNTTNLEYVADVINGIQTSAERPIPIYWFEHDEVMDEDNDYYYIQRSGKNIIIEKNITKPFYKATKREEKGKTTYDYDLKPKKMIFPYTQTGRIYTTNEMESRFPNTWTYLRENYSRLIPKHIDPNGTRDVPHATAASWFHYGRDQAIAFFAPTVPREKIIVGVLSKNPLYYFDNQGWLIASGGTAGYCAIVKKENSYDLRYLQAILNHPVIEYLVRKMGSDFEGNFASRGTYVLYRVPIKDIERNDDRYLEVINKSNQIYSINEVLSSNPDMRTFRALQLEKDQLICDIMDIVSSIYGVEDYSDIWRDT